MTTYNIWLTDAYGDKLSLMNDLSYMNYSLGTKSMGYIQLGIQTDAFAKKGITPYFLPDRRLEVWRSPAPGFTSKLERVFFLRKVVNYERQDGVGMISFYGRDAKDLLNRRFIIQKSTKDNTYEVKTGPIDDIMKEIVSQQMLWGSALDETGTSDDTRAYPQNLFTVQGNLSDGPSIYYIVLDKKVLDAMTELHELSVQMNIDSSSNHVIYYDIIEKEYNGRIAFEFQTFKDYRGVDRTGGLRFSSENGNLSGFSVSREYYEEANVCFCRGATGFVEANIPSRRDASPWSRSEIVVKSNSSTANGTTSDAKKALRRAKPRNLVDATFLSTPGGPDSPQSLYGIDWALGDLLPITYRGSYYEAEVTTLYVTINENGEESVTGKSLIGEAGAA